MNALKGLYGQMQQFLADNQTLVWGIVLVSIGLMVVSQMMTALAKGFKTCPNCQKVVPVKDAACRYCRHAFEAPSEDTPA
jgi:hypothetical protein